MKRFFLPMVLMLVAVVSLFFFFPPAKSLTQKIFSTPVPSPKSIDFIASYEITTLGTKRDFSDPKYHNLTNYVYISALDPQYVHLKKTGVTWSEFFATLPMKLTKECLTTGTGQTFCTGNGRKLRFFIGDREDSNALDLEIKPGNKFIVLYE